MGTSDYVGRLREHVGTGLLLLPGAAALVHDSEGSLLLQQRTDDGKWSLPGGAIDPGETPAAAVEREVREETGLDVVAEQVAGVFGGAAFRARYPNGDEAEYVAVVFYCRVTGGRLRVDHDESLRLAFFPLRALPPLQMAYPDALLRWSPGDPTLFDRG